MTAIPLLPGPLSPLRLFLWLRWRQFGNACKEMLGSSGIRPLTILISSMVVWAFVFVLSYAGFQFVQQVQLPLGGGIITLLFDLLFFALGLMLIFSSGLILYSSLFSTPETQFLLSSPTSDDQIFAYKFQGALAFSSWAFLLLGAPILIAYGLVTHAPWYFYLLLPLYFLAFLLFPGALGAIICLLVVNYLPKHRKQMLLLVILVVVGTAIWWIYDVASSTRSQFSQIDNRDAVQTLLGRFDLARAVWMPNHWVGQGLVHAGRGAISDALYYLALLWSNGLLLYVGMAFASLGLYRRGYNRLRTGGEVRRKHGGYWMDSLLERTLFLTDVQTRLLIIKDFRTFRRDPAQWAQILIFSSLMLIYFLNIPRLFSEGLGGNQGQSLSEINVWPYQNGISVLNLCSVALLLCTYTGRFVYPLLSLEGRKFWILGLLPLKRERLLWGKFAFATSGSAVIATTLILVSDLMLRMPALAVILHVITVLVVAAGLSGLSVGLGACLPNFKETDPSKIAVGFGGTLNLVVGLGYLLAVIGLMAGPWHVMAALSAKTPELSLWGVVLVGGGTLLGLSVSTAAIILPLHAGAKALREMEF